MLAALAVAAPAHAAGVNDLTCKPPAAHPSPVILLHGTFANSAGSWNSLAPALQNAGYCVFELDYGNNATGPVDASADAIATFAEQVLSGTGAAKVSFVGHSQGGMIARYVARFRGLLDRTDDIVGLAPSSHGTDTPLAPLAGELSCAACADQVAGSPVMTQLAEGDEAPAPASYTVVTTVHDEVVTPYTSQAIAGSGAITNVILQDACPGDITEHVAIIYDPVALQWVRNALGRAGPANPKFAPDCTGLTDGKDPDAVTPPAPPLAGTPANLAPQLALGDRLAVKKGRLVLGVRCNAARALTCVTNVVIRGYGRTVARRHVLLRGGKTAVLHMRIRRQARALTKRKRLRVHVRTTTVNGAPRVAERSYEIVLQR